MSAFFRKLRWLTQRDRKEAELREELEFHLQEEAQQRQGPGLTEEDARRAARRDFGNLALVQEDTRATWGWTMLEQCGQDVHYALRTMVANRLFTTLVVLCLALGIGANSSVFTIVDALQFKKLSVQDPERLAMLRFDTGQRSQYNIPYESFERLAGGMAPFADAAATFLVERYNVVVDGAEDRTDPAEVRIALVSGNYFALLGVHALRGRAFTPEENRLGDPREVAVISHGYWKHRFGLSPDVIGRTLTVQNTTYTIVGVTPSEFRGDWIGRPADVWVPFAVAPRIMAEIPVAAGKFPTRILARLKPGVSLEQAQASTDVIYERFLTAQTAANAVSQATTQRLVLEEASTGYSPQRHTFEQPIRILIVVAGLVLLVVCTNVATMLLARSAARQREMSVRTALGAQPWRILRQLLTESLVLAAMGGMTGVLCALWGTAALTRALAAGPAGVRSDIVSQSFMSVRLDPQFDGRILAVSLAVTLVCGLLFGLVPALYASRRSLAAGLGVKGAPGAASRERFRATAALVMIQVALSLVLSVSAGLLLRSLRNLETQEVGFDRAHLLVVTTAPVQTGRIGAALPPFYERLRQKLAMIPGVAAISLTNGGILDGDDAGAPTETLPIAGQAPKPGILSRRFAVMPGFFNTVGLSLRAGRDFNEHDAMTAPKVAIINETMAQFFFGADDPLGHRIGDEHMEIIGVVPDAKYGTPRDHRAIWYVPFSQNIRLMQLNWSLAIRTDGPPDGMVEEVRRALREVDSTLPVINVTTVDQLLGDVLVQERLMTQLATWFGGFALLLAASGVYGVVSFAVTCRTNEIGIRMALGAQRRDVLSMVLNEGLLLVIAGIVIGLPATLGATRMISSTLFGVNAADPLTITGATLLMLAVAAFAAVLPAYRASRVDPMVALRCE